MYVLRIIMFLTSIVYIIHGIEFRKDVKRVEKSSRSKIADKIDVYVGKVIKKIDKLVGGDTFRDMQRDLKIKFNEEYLLEEYEQKKLITSKYVKKFPYTKYKLLVVANYLRTKKFFQNDVRFKYSQKSERTTSMQHFPVPRLRNLNLELSKECNLSLEACILHVYRVIGLGERHINKNFFTGLLEYRYYITASYYMCWFTLKRAPQLRRFQKSCRIQYPGTNNGTIHDYRDDDSEDFECAELSFCPDPCCGKIWLKGSTPGTSPTEMRCIGLYSNPCRTIKENIKCKFSHNNINFENMQRNMFNITCPCEKRGFEYNQEFNMCIDTDECKLKNKCSKEVGMVCLNTVGAYVCVCGFGYEYMTVVKSGTGFCVKTVVNELDKIEKYS